MEIGSKIKQLRTSRGMTQKELGDRLHISAQAISRWESGEVEPSVSSINDIANIFEISLDELFGKAPNNLEEVTIENKDNTEEIINKVEELIKEKTKPVLGVCRVCNKPIYDAALIIRMGDNIYCKHCDEKIKINREVKQIENAKKRRMNSFVFGGVAALIFLIVTLVIYFRGINTSPYFLLGGIFTAIAAFTFLSCVIIGNNFIGELWVNISSWSIRFPGIIFTFDLDGFAFLIAMKILFAFLGCLISIFAFLFATFICFALSLFVYPYTIIHSIKHPEDC